MIGVDGGPTTFAIVFGGVVTTLCAVIGYFSVKAANSHKTSAEESASKAGAIFVALSEERELNQTRWAVIQELQQDGERRDKRIEELTKELAECRESHRQDLAVQREQDAQICELKETVQSQEIQMARMRQKLDRLETG